MVSQEIYDEGIKLVTAMNNNRKNLPMADLLNVVETRQIASSRSKAIFGHKDALLSMLDRYEEILR